MGKSTTGQMLARDHGFVYYEGDCFGSLKNPFINLDTENPSMDQVKQRPLNGPGAAERALLMKAVTPVFTDIMAGKKNESEPLMNYYRALGEDVKKQKERIGGNWAIATVLHSQKCRDLMK